MALDFSGLVSSYIDNISIEFKRIFDMVNEANHQHAVIGSKVNCIIMPKAYYDRYIFPFTERFLEEELAEKKLLGIKILFGQVGSIAIL